MYCGESGRKGFYNLQEVGLAKEFSKLGIQVYIIILSKKIKNTIITKEGSGILLLTVPAKSIGNHGYFQYEILKELNIDIVHLQSDNQIFAPNIIKYCKKNNIKCYNYIGTIQSNSSNIIKKIIMSFFKRRNLRYIRNTLVFSKNPTVQKQLASFNIKQSKLAPVGLDTDIIPQLTMSKEKLRNELILPQDKKLLIFVGRMENYKNPLAAIELIKSLDDSFHLTMIGKGSITYKVKESIRDYNLENKVKYIESVPNEYIHRYYKACDFFVNLNDKEIFGMSILEAMYQECTVVAIKAPGPNYIIEGCGYLYNNLNEMKEMLPLIKPLKLLSKQRILNHFNWKSTAEIIIDNLR